MPDWSYHPLKQTLLNKWNTTKSRSFIHKSMTRIASLPFGKDLIHFLGHTIPPIELTQSINGTTYPAPIGLSCSIDPLLQGTKAFQELGVGFINIGPLVLTKPETSNPPILKHNKVYFSNCPEKVSLEDAYRHITSTHLKLPIFVTLDHSVSQEQANTIMSQLEEHVQAFIIPCSIKWRNPPLTKKDIYLAINADDLIVEMLHSHELYISIKGLVIQAPLVNENSYQTESDDAVNRLTTTVSEIRSKFEHLVVICEGGIKQPFHTWELQKAGSHLLLLSGGIVTSGPGLIKRSYEMMINRKHRDIKLQNASWSILFGLCIGIGGILAFIFSLTGAILPYDENFIGLTKNEIYLLNPNLLYFMIHDRMALAGTMLSASIIYIQLARHGISRQLHWSKMTYHSAAIVGFLGILLFIGYGYFDWLHGLFWLILLPIYYVSLREGKTAKHYPSSSDGVNSPAWKLANYGQLMFVLLGFALIAGGIVISVIGISNVFISTDLAYLCMSPEMIQHISDSLIPVIAHDRAGFGSALVSVGLLVLMLALWGYRSGEKWVWNTFAVGALPAFAAGIGIHMYIGYTTFIHLLPVYLLVILYITGLILSYPYLKRHICN